MENENPVEFAENNNNQNKRYPERQIQELTTQLTLTEAQLNKCEFQLAEIYMSKEWKLVQLLRKVVLLLKPPNSWREKIGQTVLSSIMSIDFFWELLFISAKPISK